MANVIWRINYLSKKKKYLGYQLFSKTFEHRGRRYCRGKATSCPKVSGRSFSCPMLWMVLTKSVKRNSMLEHLLVFSRQFNSLTWDCLTALLSCFLIKFSKCSFFPVFSYSPPQITDIPLTFFILISSQVMTINYWDLLQPKNQLATYVEYTTFGLFPDTKEYFIKVDVVFLT